MGTALTYSRWAVVRLFHVAHLHTFAGGRHRRGSEPLEPPRRFTFDEAARLFTLNLIPTALRTLRALPDGVARDARGRWRRAGAALIDSATPTAGLVAAVLPELRPLLTVEETRELRGRLGAYSARVEYRDGHSACVYPFTRDPPAVHPMPVAIDPRVRLGRPVVAGTDVLTATLFKQHLAGDPVAEIAADHDITPGLVEEALRYEALGLARSRRADSE